MAMEMWIARDENYDLWLFTEKPERNIFHGYWYSDIGETMRLDAYDPRFKDITWHNETVKVELKLVK